MGTLDACTSTEVLQEILYRYHGLKQPAVASEVYDLFVEICPEVFAVELADTDRARSMLAVRPAIGVRDALHAAVMINRSIRHIATYDVGFDQVPGVERFAVE